MSLLTQSDLDANFGDPVLAALSRGFSASGHGQAPVSQAELAANFGSDVLARLDRVRTLLDVNGVAYQFTAEAVDARAERLASGLALTLYHSTSPDRAALILSSRTFNQGSGGLAGAAIYFATCPDDAHRKARARGVILAAEVRLGHIRQLGWGGDRAVTLKSLLDAGDDSVQIARNGTEYAVYNTDQISNIRVAETRPQE